NGEDFFSLLMKLHLNYLVDRPVRAVSPDVAESENPNNTWQHIRRWIRLYPDPFTPVFIDPQEKITIYQVESEPRFSQSYSDYRTAVQELQTGRTEEVVGHLKEALTVYPRLGSATNALGIIYMSTHRLEEAERAFLKTIEFLPDSPLAMLNLSVLYHAQG